MNPYSLCMPKQRSSLMCIMVVGGVLLVTFARPAIGEDRQPPTSSDDVLKEDVKGVLSQPESPSDPVTIPNPVTDSASTVVPATSEGSTHLPEGAGEVVERGVASNVPMSKPAPLVSNIVARAGNTSTHCWELRYGFPVRPDPVFPDFGYYQYDANPSQFGAAQMIWTCLGQKVPPYPQYGQQQVWSNAAVPGTVTDFLSFQVRAYVTVYVGCDNNAAPGWLKNGFLDTGTDLYVDNYNHRFRLYKRNYSAGETVHLGGNGGASNTTDLMYVVFVMPTVRTSPLNQPQPLLAPPTNVPLKQPQPLLAPPTSVPLGK